MSEFSKAYDIVGQTAKLNLVRAIESGYFKAFVDRHGTTRMSKAHISWSYLDRLEDVCESDTLENIMHDLLCDLRNQSAAKELADEEKSLDLYQPSYGSRG